MLLLLRNLFFSHLLNHDDNRSVLNFGQTALLFVYITCNIHQHAFSVLAILEELVWSKHFAADINYADKYNHCNKVMLVRQHVMGSFYTSLTSCHLGQIAVYRSLNRLKKKQFIFWFVAILMKYNMKTNIGSVNRSYSTCQRFWKWQSCQCWALSQGSFASVQLGLVWMALSRREHHATKHISSTGIFLFC